MKTIKAEWTVSSTQDDKIDQLMEKESLYHINNSKKDKKNVIFKEVLEEKD